MQHDIRLDKLTYGEVSVGWLMDLPPEMSPPQRIHAPPFPRTREQAAQALREFVQQRQDFPGERKIWLSKSILRQGELLPIHGPLPEELALDSHGAWVGFVDLDPYMNWEHDCLYWVFTADGEQRQAAAAWCPARWHELFTALTP